MQEMTTCITLVLISKIYNKIEAANYQHEIPASQSAMKCNYFEIFQESKDGDIYCIEEKKVALISAYCVAGRCSVLKPCQEKH